MITVLCALWAIAATVLLARQRGRTDEAVAALYVADERNRVLSDRLIRRPVSWRHPRREGVHLGRTAATPALTLQVGCAPLPAALDPAPFPDPPTPAWSAFAKFIAGMERAAA